MFKELEDFVASRKVEKEMLNILDVGYILTSDENIIKIYEDEAHANMFSAYLNFRLKNKELHPFSLAESLIMIANEFGDIVYIGPRVQDIKQLTTGNSEFRLQGFFLPDDLSIITPFQKEAMRILENSNHSVLNPNAKKIEISYFTVSSGCLLSEEEIQKLLTIPPVEKEKIQRKKL